MTQAEAPTEGSDVYYDPYDFEIDTNPYPIWKRMRDEAPLYYNEKYDFYAVSRYADVNEVLSDWKTYISGKGTLIELIKAHLESGFKLPAGHFIFEDPPEHDIHRGILARVFRPKEIAALEPRLREFCAECLDPLVGSGGFDFVRDLGAYVPMRAIGMLLGVPESEQERLRDLIDEGLKLAESGQPAFSPERGQAQEEILREYIKWRRDHPSDDLMTELIEAEFEDENGVTRRMDDDEATSYVQLLAGAGNETTSRLIGWSGKLLAEHPDQRQELVDDPRLIPNAIEELLRYEAPSPVQARYVTKDVEWYGRTVPSGSIMVVLNASANRDERKFADPDRFDIHRKIDRHVTFGYGLHFCMGAALARLEGRVALEEVLKRFPTWEVDWDNAVQARTSTVRGWEKLPVSVT